METFLKKTGERSRPGCGSTRLASNALRDNKPTPKLGKWFWSREMKSQRRGVVDGTRGACAPQNFNVPILNNGNESVTWTNRTLGVLAPWWFN